MAKAEIFLEGIEGGITGMVLEAINSCTWDCLCNAHFLNVVLCSLGVYVFALLTLIGS